MCYGVSLCYGVNPCYGVSPCYGISPCYGVSPCYVNVAWVTRPERPKGAKDEVKQAEGLQARTQTSGVSYILGLACLKDLLYLYIGT